MARRDNVKSIYTHEHPGLKYDLESDPLKLIDLIRNSDHAEIEAGLREGIFDNWNPQATNDACLQSQKERMFILKITDGNPNWAFRYRPDDSKRYVRSDSAVGTKAKARYPFVEPPPFIK